MVVARAAHSRKLKDGEKSYGKDQTSVNEVLS